MRCPACHSPAAEFDAACRHCGFCQELADTHLGLPPLITPPIADLIGGSLSAGERRAILKAIATLEQQLPQIRAVVVFAEPPPIAPVAIYTMWLFNRANLFGPLQRGGDNHGILLLLAPRQLRACLMLGYGLEPFVPEELLAMPLSRSAHEMIAGRAPSAALVALNLLTHALPPLCRALPKVFGYPPEASTPASTSDDIF